MAYCSPLEILNMAEPIGNGWSEAIIALDVGDTAYSGVSTKWVFTGPGIVRYLVHASGWDVAVDDSVTRTYLPRRKATS